MKRFIILTSFLIGHNAPANIGLDFLWKPTFFKTTPAKQSKNNFCLRKVLVAVIDTGVDIQHPDLQSFIWTNEGESGLDSHGRDKATNGLDDDGNGYIDDVHGWSFADKTADVSDHHGHGTHIAGIITGYGSQNGIQTPQCVQIMPLKYVDPLTKNQNTIQNTALSILYAIRMGAEIINYSGGGMTPSILEKQSVQLANSNHILFISASGNEASNADVKPFFPASYQTPNIISVGAVDADGNLLENSNYGSKSVDIAAPGAAIFSTTPHRGYGLMSGTSQATAFVTRTAAAVLLAHAPRSANAAALKQEVLSFANPRSSLQGKLRVPATITTENLQNKPLVKRLGQSSFTRNL